MSRPDFALGVVLGIGSGVALTVGIAGVFKRWFAESPQSVLEDSRLIDSVNAIANELKQLRRLVGSIEKDLKSQLRFSERQNLATEAERSDRTQQDVQIEHKPETQTVSTLLNNDMCDGEESTSDGSEFYEIASEFPAAAEEEGNEKVSEVADEDKEAIEPQPLEAFLVEIDQLNGDDAHYDESQLRAYTLLVEKRLEIHDNPSLLWRQARANVRMADIKKKQGESDQERKQLLYEGVDLAKAAVELDDSIWQAHKWLAITTGSTAEFEGTQKKIQNGYVFKEHIGHALELKGDDPNLWHLLGRWCFEVASLSWWERKGAAALYATPPESSFEQSLEAFLKAEELRPGFWKSNQLMLGKCYVKLGNDSEAKEWLLKAHGMAVITQEDAESQQEVESLLSTLGTLTTQLP